MKKMAPKVYLFLITCTTLFVPSLQLPNFVILLMDDMGWGDIGANGEPNKETPNIDRMAAEGLTVSSMYTSAPLCSPSRASILTGRLPIRNGFYSNNTAGRNAYTPQEIVGGISAYEILLSELLLQKNYTNALIGKWHLGHQEQYLPLNRGFHRWFGSPNCHFGPYNNVNKPNIPVFRDAAMMGRYYETGFEIEHEGESNMTVMFTNEAVKFLEEMANQTNPFFLMWTPDSVHAPTYASEVYLGKSRRGNYGDAIREVDAGVGAILQALRDTGLADNTLVVFSSDNGAALVSELQGGSNGPFLCGKQTTFEGGMRAPGIFWWPGTISPGIVTHQVWTHMDLFSTFLQLADVIPPDDRIYDGLGLANSLFFPNLEILRNVFLYRGDRLMAVRRGSYKMHLWTWNTTPEELAKGIDYCPGERQDNVTTSVPMDHGNQPIIHLIDADVSERYPLTPNSAEYNSAYQEHWAPPGCEALGQCLPAPPSAPYLCEWPH